MTRAILFVALLASCGGSKKSADPPPASSGPHSTVDQSLNPQGTAWNNVQQRPAYTTLDPNLVPGGAAAAPPAAPPPKPVQAAAKPAAPPAGAGSGAPVAKTPTSTLSATPPTSAGSGAAPVPTAPAAPAAPAAPVAPAAPQPKAVLLAAPSTPNSCAKHGRECAAMVTPAVAGPPTAANKGTITGQLVTPDQMPACPVDLVDGATRRVTTGTFRAGKYELSATPGHYAVSFERCLGCDPGTVPADIVDGGSATVVITCRAK